MTLLDEGDLDGLNRLIDSMVEKGQIEADAWKPVAEDGLAYLYGDQPVPGRKEGFPDVRVNYCFPAVMQQVALLTNREMKIEAEPVEEHDQAATAFWGPMLQWQFGQELKIPDMLGRAVLDVATHGHAVVKVVWDQRREWLPTYRRWRAGPRLILLRPQLFGAEPGAESLDEAAWVYCQRTVTVEKAVKQFPEHEEAILRAAEEGGREYRPEEMGGMAESGLSQEKARDKGDDRRAGRLVDLLSGVATAARLEIQEDDSDDPRKKSVTITEIYWRDDETRHQEERGPIPPERLTASGLAATDGIQHWVTGEGLGLEPGTVLDDTNWPTEVVQEWDEPVYPHGRFVLRIGKEILNPDTDAQVWPLRKWPFVVGIAMPLPHTWRGLNAVEMSLSMQDWINCSASHIGNYINCFGDPRVTVEDGALQAVPSGTPAKKVAASVRARAGAVDVLVKGGIGKMVREPPPPMSQGLLDAYMLFAREIQDHLGMQEVARGRQAKGQVTAYEISRLAEFSQVRTSMAGKFMNAWILAVMGLVAEMDRTFYGADDFVRILGRGAAGLLQQMPADMAGVEFDVRLDVGTALPADQERKRQDATALFQAVGLPMLPELLQAFEVPNPEEILARVAAWQELQSLKAAQSAPKGKAEGA